MFCFLKKLSKNFKWSPFQNQDSKIQQGSLLISCLIVLIEDALFWKRTWLSIVLIVFINISILVCAYWEVTFLDIILDTMIIFISLDALETWLKYKHRTSFLKRIAGEDRSQLRCSYSKLTRWLQGRWSNFIYLKETNHAKAFLITNIILITILVLGKCINVYLLVYILCMLMCTFHIIAPPICKILKKIQITAESDSEIDNLIPEVSDKDLNELSFEPERVVDDRQSLDYWKPEEIAIEDESDSSETSSSMVTNLSMEKLPKIEKDVETSDTSDDEYIPLVKQSEQLQSTLEIEQPGTWTDSAFNALRSFTGVVSNIYPTDNKRTRVPSNDSSDGFEMIDKKDLL